MTVIKMKVDHGLQSTAVLFRKETQLFGFELAGSYMGKPNGNAIVERVIGTIKWECIWHHRFQNLSEPEQIISS